MNKLEAQLETEKIVQFLKSVFVLTGKSKVAINWSGGVDSTVCLYLLAKSLPIQNITILHLPYERTYEDEFLPIFEYLQINKSQFRIINIKSMVDEIRLNLKISDVIRGGNVMARMRMIVAYDYAKKSNALVCGTENRTEDLLGYFTRFGDAASDIEPICHLYKTHVFELGEFLGVPNNILEAHPTAGLWEGQTDEAEFGFTYNEADEVLFRYFDLSKNIEEIEKEGFRNARRIIEFSKKNAFKHEVPYKIS